MSDAFAVRFMQLALQITQSERGLAVNRQLQVLGVAGMEDYEVQDADFTGFQNIQRAFQDNNPPLIANSVILDPNNAPVTNTNFSQLRLVVVFVLGDEGAAYVDRHIRSGVIDRDLAARLQTFADHLLANNQTDMSLEAMWDTFHS